VTAASKLMKFAFPFLFYSPVKVNTLMELHTSIFYFLCSLLKCFHKVFPLAFRDLRIWTISKCTYHYQKGEQRYY